MRLTALGACKVNHMQLSVELHFTVWVLAGRSDGDGEEAMGSGGLFAAPRAKW